MENKELIVIIMAGGLGKRMNSDIPKVLHPIGDIPMLVHVIRQAQLLNPYKIFIVVGKFKEIIENTLREYIIDLNNNIEYVLQEQALGTGHAIMCCRDKLIESSKTNPVINVLVLSGDVPLITSNTMNKLISICSLDQIGLIVTNLIDPTGYGRIIENKNGVFDKIVEEKDCNSSDKLVTKVNCGIYAFNICTLCKYLPYIKNENSQNEYYLTDIVEIIKNKSESTNIKLYNIPQDRQYEIIGVNTIEQLNNLSYYFLV